jgi:hypothetical protein
VSNRRYGKKCFYQINITIDSRQQEIIDHIKTLIRNLFGYECSLYKRKDSRATIICLNKKEIFDCLIGLGLRSGSKVKNNISVPDWIKKESSYTISCLRGLMDTDGCIHSVKRDNAIYVVFSNHVKNLLDDFSSMCQNMGLNIYKGQDSVHIYEKKSVSSFLNIVRPIKWLIKVRDNPDLVDRLKYVYNLGQ